MNDRPDAGELLEAVARFLTRDLLPSLDGHLGYQTRVAANVVRIVAREIESEERHLRGEWQRLVDLMEADTTPALDGHAQLRQQILDLTQRLCERIRAGDGDAGPWREALLAHLEQTVDDKLEVAKGPTETRRAD
jgi:hypothetical protein